MFRFSSFLILWSDPQITEWLFLLSCQTGWHDDLELRSDPSVWNTVLQWPMQSLAKVLHLTFYTFFSLWKELNIMCHSPEKWWGQYINHRRITLTWQSVTVLGMSPFSTAFYLIYVKLILWSQQGTLKEMNRHCYTQFTAFLSEAISVNLLMLGWVHQLNFELWFFQVMTLLFLWWKAF